MVKLAGQESELFTLVGIFGCQAWKESRFMLRKPVVAAMFETFGKVPTIASEFWETIATGLRIDSKLDARYKLREDLLKKYTPIPTGRKLSDVKRNMTDEQVYRLCIVAWNRWRKDEKVQVLKWTKSRMRAM
jgi:hypothetical protein